MNFTGNKDTDYEILYHLDDYSLSKICRLNSYMKSLCNNDTFWYNKTMKRFSFVLGGESNIRKFQQGFINWKGYYISLINHLENLYENDELIIPGQSRGEDFKLIEFYVDKNTREFVKELSNFDSYEWKEILKRDFLNPSHSTIYIILYHLYKERQKEFFTVVTKDPRFRITKNFYYASFDREIIELIFENIPKTDSLTYNVLYFLLRDIDLEHNDDVKLYYVSEFLDSANGPKILEVMFDLILDEDEKLKKYMMKRFLKTALKNGSTIKDIMSNYKNAMSAIEDEEENENRKKNLKFIKKYIKN